MARQKSTFFGTDTNRYDDQTCLIVATELHWGRQTGSNVGRLEATSEMYLLMLKNQKNDEKLKKLEKNKKFEKIKKIGKN